MDIDLLIEALKRAKEEGAVSINASVDEGPKHVFLCGGSQKFVPLENDPIVVALSITPKWYRKAMTELGNG